MTPSRDLTAVTADSARPAPHVIVLFGGTGDLARRKLLPGLFHLSQARLLPDCRIIATALDEIDDEDYRQLARKACDEFARGGVSDAEWERFRAYLRYVPGSLGAPGLAVAVAAAESELVG